MKLSRLFLIATLVGTLAAIGCGDDETGNGGTAGTGGTAGSGGNGTGGGGGTVTDPCTGGFCDDPSEPKTACELAIDFCKSPDCCEGVNPTDDQCNAFGEALCTLDFGGAGGAGGGDGGPDAMEVCANCDSTEQARIDACESAYDTCIANPPSGPADEVQEKCTVFALSRCGL
jgi:hypothetical protein